jgi:hypothetical protein
MDMTTFDVNGKQCVALVRKLTPREVFRLMGVDDARKRYEQYIKGSMMDLILEAVSETKYVDYFPYNE